MRSAKMDQASRSLYLYAAYHTARPVKTLLAVLNSSLIASISPFFFENKVKYPPLRQVAPLPTKDERLCI